MRRSRIAALLAASLLVTGAAFAGPPSRPLPVTQSQFRALQHLQSEPGHAAIRQVRATYESERERQLELTRLSDDIWTAAYQAGFPATILTILICAAPL